MKKVLTITLLMLILLFAFFSCKSQPPAAEPSPTPSPGPTSAKETPGQNSLGKADFEKAEKAITRAEEAGAGIYASKLLEEAKQLLKESKESKDSSTGQEKLKLSLQKSDEAYNLAVKTQKEKDFAQIDKLIEKLNELDAENFIPEKYKTVLNLQDEVKGSYDKDDFFEARKKSAQSISQIDEIYKELDDALRWVQILKRDTNTYFKEAENVEAEKWAAEELEGSREKYQSAEKKYEEYQLEASTHEYSEAKMLALKTVRLARRRKAEAAADEHMMRVMERIEKASEKTVVTEEGEVIEAEKWDGQKEKKEIEQAVQQKIEEEYLDDKTDNSEDSKAGSEGKGDELMPSATPEEEINEDTVGAVHLKESFPGVVLGDEEKSNMLKEAKRLWKLGVEEKALGNFERAHEYFSEAEKYIEAYEALAVEKTYTVRLIPERRDCLWRIAEYNFIYNDASRWPEIWRRNRKLIQNPDLIFPGWNLIIPPK